MRPAAWLVSCAILVAAIGALALPKAAVTDVAPQEGMVAPGSPAHLTLTVSRPWYDPRPATVTISRGLDRTPVAVLKTRGTNLTWTPPAAGGYGVTATLGKSLAETALDVGTNWAEKPRYGFLSDFAPQDAGQTSRFDTLAKFHINGLQFYDWHHLHSDYLPPAEEYRDPLGRLLSKSVLLEKLSLAHSHGMAAMAYTAVYAAPGAFFAQHPEWALYDDTGKALSFGNGFLYIMNPEKGSPWAAYTLDQYRQIVTALPFDGIHLDQFGSPKFGRRYPGGTSSASVDVAAALANLIDATKSAVAPKPVFFNDVGAWPLADTAPTANDAVYIEVWPPYVNFQHLYELIERGRALSGGKPVILAAYIPPSSPASVLLTDAVIFASGGYHLELGEGDGMLADPYFPKYQRMSPDLAARLRRYYDVAVRYQDLLYGKDLTPWDPEVTIAGSRVIHGGYFGGVWPLGRQSGSYRVLNLINLNGLTDAHWNAERTALPTQVLSPLVTIESDARPKAVWRINPDGASQAPESIPFTYADGQVRLRLDRLDLWSMIVLEQ